MSTENGLATRAHDADVIDIHQRPVAERDFDEARRIQLRLKLPQLAWDSGGREEFIQQIFMAKRMAHMAHMEIARWLLYARENLDAKEWRRLVEEECGISYDWARLLCRNAIRAQQYRFAERIDSPRKLDTLFGFASEQLKALDETGEIDGMTLDEINEMPVTRLKRRLKELEAKVDKGKAQIKKRDEAIASLKKDVERLSNDTGRDESDPFFPACERLFAAINDFEFALQCVNTVDSKEIAHAYLCAQRMLAAVKERCEIDLTSVLRDEEAA